MDAARFARELPRLFDDFPRSPQPRDRRFGVVLEAVPGLARENNLALLNLAAACVESGESYVEVGSLRGTSLIGAMLGNDGDFVAIDDFSFRDASRERLEANLGRFGLDGRATVLEGDAFELLLVTVGGVVVVDADGTSVERAVPEELERVALEDRRAAGEPEAGEVLLELCARAVAEGEVVDRDRVERVVPEQRRDQARAPEGAGLDVALTRAEQAHRVVQEREVVLAREAGDIAEHVGEAAVARVRGPREVVEEPRELPGEARGVHPPQSRSVSAPLRRDPLEDQRDQLHREDGERERGQERSRVHERMRVRIESHWPQVVGRSRSSEYRRRARLRPSPARG